MNKIPEISSYLKDSIDNEFEIVFDRGTITYDNFINILSVLKNNTEYSYLVDTFNQWNNVTVTNELDISVHPTEDTNSLSLRWTLCNEKDIQTYCKTNNLSDLDYQLIYKKPVKPSIIDEDFKLKYNLKVENRFDKETQKFMIDLPESNQEYDKYKDLLVRNKNNFKNLYKSYRLKNRYSFTDKYGIHSLDLTIVRSSKKKMTNSDHYIPVKKISESNIFNEPKTYEIELELNKNIKDSSNKTLKSYLDKIVPDNKISVKKITKEIFFTKVQTSVIDTIQNCVKFVYSAINHYPFIISMTDSNNIFTSYKDFINTKKIEMINSKLDTLSKLDEPDLSEDTLPREQQLYLSTIDRKDVLFHKEKLLKLRDSPIQTNYFIGPKPVSMELEHLQPQNENYILNKSYCVTDKADGIGKLLFVTNNELYLIDNNYKIYKTGIRCQQFDNCLFNCEFIKHQNLVMIYDTYFIDKPLEDDSIRELYQNVFYRDLFSNITHGSEINNYTRLEMAQHFIDTAKLEYIDESYPFKISIQVKKFLDVTVNFSANCQEIWNNRDKNLYNYDGLIFTPNNLPVGFDNSPDYDLYSHSRWDFNIKWKPPHENTIDFLIKESTDDLVTKIVKSNGSSNIKKFKVYDLYVGQVTKNTNPCESQLKTFIKNTNIYLPTLFTPTQPYTENIHKAYLEIEPKSKKSVCKLWDESTNSWISTKNMIDNNSIVEFAYNIHSTDEKGFRWVPVKIRNDKTVAYHKGTVEQNRIFNMIQELCNNTTLNSKIFNIVKPYLKKNPKLRDISLSNFKTYKNYIQSYYREPLSVKVFTNYGNDFNTANNVWKTIHNPVTEEILLNVPDKVPLEIDNDDKYYNKRFNYSREKSLTLSLQEFHNKIIKSKILLYNAVNYCNHQFEDDTTSNNLSLLDLATGKGGDLFKWKLSGINKVVGIDNVKDNIFNKNDGACVRRNNLFSKSIKPKNFDVYFLQGDVTNNINSGEAFQSTSMQLFNERWKSNEEFQKNKFNIISMMFAIHYMFKDETVLDKLINNIDENLKPGGLFIGACLDGEKTFNYLSDIRKNEYKIGTSSTGEKLWSIQKKYDSPTFSNDNTSLNNCISIKMYSINTEQDEYLVNFEYLKNKLAEKNIILLDDSELLYSVKSTGTLDTIFEKLKSTSFDVNSNTLSTIKNMSDDEKIISFLTRYFIFKKMIT